MSEPKVFADFQNADEQGRVRLNTIGTTRDLSRQKVAMRDGIALRLYDHDEDDSGNPVELQALGKVAFSQEEQCWVAAIDGSKLERVRLIRGKGSPT